MADLPNPNPSGTASVAMMQLSFQETSTNYLQGIYEEMVSLKNLLSSILVVNTGQLNYDKGSDKAAAQKEKIDAAKEKATDAETKRESRFARAGGALRGAATSIRDRGKDLFAKTGGISGFLSTIIGAGLLGAIFFPERTKEMISQLQKGFGDLMDSEFMAQAIKHAKGIS